MKKFNVKVICLTFLILGILSYSNFCSSFRLDINRNNTFLKESAIIYNKITVISDDNTNWNTGSGITPGVAPGLGPQFGAPDMTVDLSGTIHVVWVDETEGSWGGGWPDCEIMYVNYTEASGWSNAIVISDGYNGIYWNDKLSYSPSIAVDNTGNIHVAWVDETDGIWGTDDEIMYVNYTEASGWSNATLISDGFNGEYWNDGISRYPSIAVDTTGKVHVAWVDQTDGIWGTDDEIMYVSNDGTGWTNATVISDGFNGEYWNDEFSWDPSIGVDGNNNIHVIWTDNTDGIWGSDVEIMYVSNEGIGWSNATVISDGFNGEYLNNNNSMRANIAISDSNNIHVVWYNSPDLFYMDYNIQKIMYTNYTEGIGWSDISIVSDLVRLHNITSDYGPDIAVDSDENVYVVWNDLYDDLSYDGSEILYSSNTGSDWSDPQLISDDETNWNNGASLVPSIAIDPNNNIHMIWEDETDGTWGIDDEILYTSVAQLPPTSPPGDKLPIPLIITLSVVIPVVIASIIAISRTIYKKKN